MTTAPATCGRCLKPEALCVCTWVQPVESRLHVLILQHPREPDRVLGSAQIAHLCLPNSTLRIGLSWANLGAALGAQAQPREWIVLYLGAAAPAQPARQPLCFVNRRGDPLPEGPARGPVGGLVVLDGTWSQAKALWWRNPWLLKLRRVVLSPARPSLYRTLRKEPRPEGLSTIEAIALCLSSIEGRPDLEEALLLPFRKLLERSRHLARRTRSSRGRRGPLDA